MIYAKAEHVTVVSYLALFTAFCGKCCACLSKVIRIGLTCCICFVFAFRTCVCASLPRCGAEEDENDDAFLLQEVVLMEALHRDVKVWHLPLLVLGAFRTSLADKFTVFSYGCFLVGGSSHKLLSQLTSSVEVHVSDFGVEFGLPLVQPVKISDLFPWFAFEQELPSHSEMQACDDDFHVIAEPDASSLPCVSLTNALAAPGLLHMIHNAANRVIDVMPSTSEAIDSLSEACDFFSDSHTSERVAETCFSGPVSKLFKRQILKFRAKVHRQRWGSIAFAESSFLQLKVYVRRFWSLPLYMQGAGAANPAIVAGTERGPKLQMVNDAITSSLFWGQLMTLDFVYELVRRAFAWVESCPCHGHLDFDSATPDQRKIWESCFMRSLRLPEIASGDFIEMFRLLCDVTAAQLMLSLPEDISEAERGVCLQEFERGRAHLLFEFTLKLHAYGSPPLLLFAVAHHKHDRMRRALKTCLEAQSKHPKIKMLQASPLREQAMQVLEGSDIQEHEELQMFVARLRFGSASERGVEAGHAIVNRRASGARCRTEAFDSLSMRYPEIRANAHHDSLFLESLIASVDYCRSPCKAVEALGLSRHPSIPPKAHAWDAIYRRIVYHSDPATLYAAPLPFTVSKGDDGDDPPLPPPLHPPADASATAAPSPDAPIAADAGASSLTGGPSPPIAVVERPAVAGVVACEGLSEAVDASTIVLVSRYDELKQRYALKFFQDQVREINSQPERWFFSCSMGPDAVRSLESVLTSDGSDHAHSIELLDADEGRVCIGHSMLTDVLNKIQKFGHVFFSVVVSAPSVLKRASKGGLVSGDIGISVHKVLGCEGSHT